MFPTRREPGSALVSFSDLILFPFLLLFFYIVPYPSISSMSFLLIYSAVVSGRHSICVFRTVAICFWPAGNLECPCLFFDLIPFPFLLLFFYLFLTLPFLLCLFHWPISAVVSGGAFYLLFSPTVAICFWPAGNLECPCLFSNLILFLLSSSFSSILFLTLPFFSSMSFSLIYICCSLILFPFPLLFFYIVPYPSFSSMSMSFSLIYICCCFRGGILSVVFPTVGRFWTTVFTGFYGFWDEFLQVFGGFFLRIVAKLLHQRFCWLKTIFFGRNQLKTRFW